jgi:hypothetical protein
MPTLEALYTEDCVLRLIGGVEGMMGTQFRGQAAAIGWMRDVAHQRGGDEGALVVTPAPEHRRPRRRD